MDNNEYISKQKVEKWTTKEKFNAFDLSTIEPGTEYNLTGAIEEGELDSALQTKINGKLTAPTTPTAESAVTMLADGTVSTKVLSEIGGKLYKHDITLSPGFGYFTIYNRDSTAYTMQTIGPYIMQNNYKIIGSSNYQPAVFYGADDETGNYIGANVHSGVNKFYINNTAVSDVVTEV